VTRTRCLIVDDEGPARDRLRHLLADAAVDIVGEAADGQEAIESVARLSPDLVFLDIQMPALSGLQAAARLPVPKPRVVFCTAFDQFAIDAFELHAVDYLLKPVNRERLLRTIARVSGEIADERRRAHEHREAARTQARLMPASAPETAGLDCAAHCVPADGVGGDYYDLLPLGNGGVALALGDVSGKGTYAGLLAAALQARMQTLTARGSHSPSDLLSELNRLTVGTIDDNRFATVFFGAFDPAARTLTYANAGHPPALIVSKAGCICRLDSTGPAVGWIASSRFDELVVQLTAGDVIAVYSDGLSETCGPDGLELGTGDLAEIVRRHAALGAASIVKATIAEVERFAHDAPAADDRTLLVAKVV
jgi:serine phosphatase RsbU (regulator of sigma subunit)